jgi:GNAT superfamily N-acetyltransferase
MSQDVIPLEVAEIEACADLYRSASPVVAEQCGVVLRELGAGQILAATRLDVLALNRALGVGLDARPGDDALNTLVDSFEAIGSPRFFVQVAPTDESVDVGPRLEGLGLRHYNNWMRLGRELVDLPSPPASTVTVRPIGPEHADIFSRIVAEAFGYPPEVAPLAGCVVGRARWRHYLAYEEDEAIAGAALYVAGEAGWLGFAATKADRRGRGAQTALVARRLEDAASEGCRWVSVETAEQTHEREAPSYRNLMRLGFSVAYRRPNYLWRREGPR